MVPRQLRPSGGRRRASRRGPLARRPGHRRRLLSPEMLVGLSIRNVVLIEHLTLSLRDGLSALTGGTGAGKSILLDALGLALGGRRDAGLVRSGAEAASGSGEHTSEHQSRMRNP